MATLGVALLEGQRVLITWDSSSSIEALQLLVKRVQSVVSPRGEVCVENTERLLQSAHPGSSFDVAVLGLVPGSVTVHSAELLAEVTRILKPSGTLVIQEPTVAAHNILRLPSLLFFVSQGSMGTVTDVPGTPAEYLRWVFNLLARMQLNTRDILDDGAQIRTPARLSSALTLSGLTEVTQLAEETLSEQGVEESLAHKVRMTGKKPNYEVGSSLKLSLPKRQASGKPSVDPAAAKLWTLSANDMNDEDVDLLDSDDLLDQEDLRKPPPSSLRTSGCGEGSEKRKACKNCTCGLAEELQETNAKTTTQKAAPSACGNCYLGDAFRCASCPYIGMPAFKPGEKVRLNPTQLQDV